MKIVLANKYYFLKGGAERHLFDLERLLAAHGHETVPFAMRDSRNRTTSWSRHFVSPVQTERVSFGWQGLRTVGRSLYSVEAKRKFSRLLDEVRPDLVHVHNIYRQISPSILPEAKRRGLPVVATVHDYALCAPNYSLYHDGKICEITRPNRYFRAVGHRCVKNSRAASLLAASELWLHDRLGLYRKNIDRFLVPSRFLKAMMVEYGWREETIDVLPLSIDANKYQPSYGKGGNVLFVGRLSQEKGVEVLIRAASLYRGVPFRIVGSGPEEGRLKSLASDLKADNVVFVGQKEGTELLDEYANCRLLVVPSEWYEVFGLVSLEGMAHGKPVIASRIGGLPEVVRDGETGVLTEAGNPVELAEAIYELWKSPETCEEMGRAGRRRIETVFTPERFYQGLKDAYAKVGVEI
ncbi:glycosyltransferase family 4 protein [Candidatus Uhrbacteria bacterium]|nr:glycosyltransferase family 4 protein [Candidatus Uhrbacteria bacterium]